MNNLLFVVAVLPFFLMGDIKGIRSDVHFKLYDELISNYKFDTSDFWISVGRSQAFSEVLFMIDLDILETDPT